MFKLGSIRALDVAHWSVRLHNATIEKSPHLDRVIAVNNHPNKPVYRALSTSTYSREVILHPKTFKVSAAENYSPEILIDGFEKSFRSRVMEMSSREIGIPAITIYSDLKSNQYDLSPLKVTLTPSNA